MPDSLTILSSIGASGFLTAALIFLTKSIISERLKGAIKDEYDQKLETHKAQLKAENEISLERFRSQLQREAAEHSIRLTGVIKEVIDTVIELHKQLLAFHDAVGNYTKVVEYASDPPKEERRKIAAEKFQSFLSYYRPRKLFLPKEIAQRIDHFFEGLYKTAVNFKLGVEDGGDISRFQQKGEDKDSWSDAHNFMNGEVPKLLEVLEDDLRHLLGTDRKKSA